jgi:hypothetical protein
MTTTDVLTLLLALWGAILSTYLGIREIKKEKKQLLIYLEHVYPAEIIQMVVVNIGHRPITLTNAGVHLYLDSRKKIPYDHLPFTPILPNNEPYPFPVTLNDGEHITLAYSEELLLSIKRDGLLANAFVYDVEGRLHRSSEVRDYDSRHESKWPYKYRAKRK